MELVSQIIDPRIALVRLCVKAEPWHVAPGSLNVCRQIDVTGRLQFVTLPHRTRERWPSPVR